MSNIFKFSLTLTFSTLTSHKQPPNSAPHIANRQYFLFASPATCFCRFGVGSGDSREQIHSGWCRKYLQSGSPSYLSYEILAKNDTKCQTHTSGTSGRLSFGHLHQQRWLQYRTCNTGIKSPLCTIAIRWIVSDLFRFLH